MSTPISPKQMSQVCEIHCGFLLMCIEVYVIIYARCIIIGMLFTNSVHIATINNYQVVRVRHSKRVHCRCTFTIKWLHQDLEGETLTVPSSSIMKLATKSINVHPVVAVFLKSVKQMHSSCSSPSPTVLEETNSEMDLNYFLEKQIEEINSSANASKEGISEDILLGVNGRNATHYFINFIYSSVLQFSFYFFFSLLSFLPFLFGPMVLGEDSVGSIDTIWQMSLKPETPFLSTTTEMLHFDIHVGASSIWASLSIKPIT